MVLRKSGRVDSRRFLGNPGHSNMWSGFLHTLKFGSDNQVDKSSPRIWDAYKDDE